MRKITKLLFTLALLTGAVGGVNSVKAAKVDWSPAGWVATWDGGTNTMSWNGSDGYKVMRTGLPTGDISAYGKIHYTITSITGDNDYIQLKVVSTGKSDQTINLTVGDHDINFADYTSLINFADVTEMTLWGTGSSDGTAVITDFYLYEPPTLNFDASGRATVDKFDLSATGGLSYNNATGVLTSDGSAGTLVLEFADPVDLRNLFHFNVARSGASGSDDIVNRLVFYDEDNALINTWNGIKWSNTWNANGIDDNATNAFINHKPVKKLVWQSDEAAAKASLTLTITSVQFILKTISCAKAGETQLKTLAWNKIDDSGTVTPDWNMNVATDTYYGNYSSDPTHYVDITAYEELRIYRDNNDGFRAFFINAAGNATNTISSSDATWNSAKKYWSIDLSGIEKWKGKVALKSIKSASSGTKNIVRNIVVYNTPAVNAPQYILTGSGMQLAETVAALADETVTCIDATGVTGITTNTEAGRTLLTSANPNCLFLGTVGDGYLANTKNVITSSVCANLELTDGKPFKAPAAFTATDAKFTKTVGAAGYATMMIPFDAALPSGVTAYNLTGVSGETITSSSAASITADNPVLIKATDGNYNFTATDAAISATADGVLTNGLLKGAYAATTAAADADNYVLQNNAGGVNFYLVTGSAASVPPFRAYLNTPFPARALYLDLDGASGIVDNNRETITNNRYYNLNGQRVAKAQKGLYIQNGKKLIMK